VWGDNQRGVVPVPRPCQELLVRVVLDYLTHLHGWGADIASVGGSEVRVGLRNAIKARRG